ncbi:MAG TPA: hypothetical protein VKK31_17710 [Thermoanaerobaculia bacterium]|nr:hypothetical protein [Thermoanaerobaculia bacterium]
MAALDQAEALGRRPELALIQKGFTLEVMGEYERAIEVLLQAQHLVERAGDRRLENMLHCNLGFTLCHVGRFAEAAELAREVRDCAAEMGMKSSSSAGFGSRAASPPGLGQTGEARSLLRQARQQFAAREMDYDVALALLEEAAG